MANGESVMHSEIRVDTCLKMSFRFKRSYLYRLIYTAALFLVFFCHPSKPSKNTPPAAKDTSGGAVMCFFQASWRHNHNGGP